VPPWAQAILATAAVVTALGVLFKKVIGPGYRAAGAAEKMLPVMQEVTDVFAGETGALAVLKGIASEFRPDSGTSLRDSIDEIGKVAEINRQSAVQFALENKRANEMLAVRFEAMRQLDEQRAQQQERLLLQVDRLTVRVDALIAQGAGIVGDRAQVARDLAAREKKVDKASGGVASDLTERQRQIDEASSGVASDLAASRKRADDTPNDEVAGTAADAASQTPEEDPG
jgi:hypothetical protein